MSEMYASARLFSNRRPFRPTVGLLGGLSACALLCGCAGGPFGDAKVDPRSPIAGEVAKVARANRTYPTFASIPPAPNDLRAPRLYGREARAIEQARIDLERKTAPETWSLGGSESFAARARAEVASETPPQGAGDTAAFVTSGRQRATPPPPPER